MTNEQKVKLILMGKKTTKKYITIQNQQISQKGHVFHTEFNMTQTALKAFTDLLGEPVTANWDEVCEVFDSIKALP